jgi:hypothetical protein
MSTRSRIGRINKDGSVESVYCHSDGYPLHNGKTLIKHYSQQSDIDKIVSLGDMSFLDNVLETSQPGHSFDHRIHGVSVFYGRDRGDEGIEAAKVPNLEAFLKGVRNDVFIEYAYLWNGKSYLGFDSDGKELNLAYEILWEIEPE